MLYIGIDIASKKHDCCIISEKGEILAPIFTFKNDSEGYDILLKTIRNLCHDFAKVKVGLEATGHYGTNLISFLHGVSIEPIIFNPLQVDLYRKASSLRKTKTDKADAKFIAQMLLTTGNSPLEPIKSEITELKALVRHRHRIKAIRTRLKVSVSRLVTILFPELPTVVCSIHQASSYALLLEYPTASDIADCHLTKLTNLLSTSSRGSYGKEKALKIKELATKSIGNYSLAVGFELQQTLRIIGNIEAELKILDNQIKKQMILIDSPILSIPGISYNLGSVILSEIGNIENFSTPSKLLAFAGMEPSTYQSGNFNATKTSMVKRGSPYLRWAILQASRLIVMREPMFKEYSDKKIAEGKHYFVAQSHVGRKLIRVIFHLLKNNQKFIAS